MAWRAWPPQAWFRPLKENKSRTKLEAKAEAKANAHCKALHEQVFRSVGVCNFHSIRMGEFDLAAEMRMSAREADIVYYLDRSCPWRRIVHRVRA